MTTLTHDFSLVWNNNGVVATRYFELNDNVYFCSYVKDTDYIFIYIGIKQLNEYCYQVVPIYKLKLHSDLKGVYFNFGYWVDNYAHKIKKIYMWEF